MVSELGDILRQAVAEHRGSLGDWTVLAAKNDPYRADQPRFREAGDWFALHWERLGRRFDLHCRGYHYVLLGEEKPNGQPYRNIDKDWVWVQEQAIDGARWNGLIPFEAIADQRNQEPVIRNVRRTEPLTFVYAGSVAVGLPEELEPQVGLVPREEGGLLAVQPFRIAIFGEKVSLDNVIGPIVQQYGASVYLPTGESSDALVYALMRDAAEDGRPLVVLYLSDCDPAGYQMAISVARKMQALRDLYFPDVSYRLHRVALTPEQVREFELPSTPLKESERRGDRWRAAFGIEQTEIDALATLRPDLLKDLLTDALDRFYDHTLDRRVEDAIREWERQAQELLDASLDPEALATMRENVEPKLGELADLVTEINDALQVDTPVELPVFEAPEPVERDYGLDDDPIADSDWDYPEQTRRLKARKAYEPNGGGE